METNAKSAAGRVSGARAPLVALALALLLGVGTANHAGAERVPANGDSHQRACRALQDRNNALLAEYKLVGATNPGSARIDDILAELRRNGQTWNDIKCNERYGSIGMLQLDDSWVVHELEPSRDHLAPVEAVLPLLTGAATGLAPAAVEDPEYSMVAQLSDTFVILPSDVQSDTVAVADPVPALETVLLDVPSDDLGVGGINPVSAPMDAEILPSADALDAQEIVTADDPVVAPVEEVQP